MAKIDPLKSYPIYFDKELVTLWQFFDANMWVPALRMKVELFRTMLCTGIRECEAVTIKVEDCHENLIDIHHGKGNKYRQVEVPPVCLPYYQQFVSERRAQRAEYLFEGHRCIRIQTRCRHLSPRRIREWWKDIIIPQVGIRYIRLHGLRHTFTSWWAEVMRPADMQDQLGHSKWQTTDGYYRFSIPGRRFKKTKPEWMKVAEAGAEKMNERQGLHVVGG